MSLTEWGPGEFTHLLVRGKIRRSGAGTGEMGAGAGVKGARTGVKGAAPTAITVTATECWDLPALEEIRLRDGIAAVRAAMEAGDVDPGARLRGTRCPGTRWRVNRGTAVMGR